MLWQRESVTESLWPTRSTIRPDTLPELLGMLGSPRLDRYRLFWRGVADIKWRLDPGMVRKLASENGCDAADVTEDQVAEADAILLSEARAAQFHRLEAGRELNNDELRARLQHQGAGTRLLDVSSNVFTALWMAVDEKKVREAPGALFAIDMSSAETDRVEVDLATAVSQHPNALFLWETPLDVDARIRAQSGKFLASAVPAKREDRKNTSLALKFVNSNASRLFSDTPGHGRYAASPTIVFELSYDLKVAIKKFLERVVGMSAITVYPDLAGFARANSA